MDLGKGLKSLSEVQLRDLFQQSKSDLPTLMAINAELKTRRSEGAIDLQFEVAQQIVHLRKSSDEPVAQSLKPVGNWLNAFLLTRGLKRPDGRPLSRYRMTDEEYSDAKKILRLLARQGRLAVPDERAGRLFVAYCAEWFRREAASMFKEWNELAPDVFPSVPYQSKLKLTEFGLNYWRRDLIRMANQREFLLTLALEGGIPVHVITDQDRGWLNAYLRTVMRASVSDPSEDAIRLISFEEAYLLRQSYRHDLFIDACAELVHRVLYWRRTADTEAPQVDAVVYLDACHPHWRADLPVYVPKTESHEARILLNGLMNEPLTGLAVSGIQANRYLFLEKGEWIPALQIVADGHLRRDKLPGLAADSRYRAVPSGELSNFIADEFALFEPPVDDQRTWRVKPRLDLSRLLKGFAFKAPVTTTLTSGSTLYPMVWPHGEAIRSDILVFEAEEEKHGLRLRLVAQGSTSRAAKVLYALMPADWEVQADTPEAILEIEHVPNLKCRLVKTDGTLYLRSPDDPADLRYRVEAGKDERQAELRYLNPQWAGIESTDANLDILEGALDMRIGEDDKLRMPAAGELFWRRPGQAWQAVRDGSLKELGLVEVSWRDPKAGIQLERRCLGLLPGGASIRANMVEAKRGDVALVNLPGWKLSPRRPDLDIVDQHSEGFSVTFPGRPDYRLVGDLLPPIGRPLPVRITFRGRDAVIIKKDGAVVAPGETLDLASLRGTSALVPYRTSLQISRIGARTGSSCVTFEGEFALSARRSVIESMLAEAGHQDAQIELAFLGDSRPSVRLGRYRFDRPMQSAGLVDLPATRGTVVARMVCQPEEEHELTFDSEGPGYRAPAAAYGPTLIYMRDGPDVVSRPVVVDNKDRSFVRREGLITAVTEIDFKKRQGDITNVLSEMGSPAARPEDISYLVKHVVTLNGVPASAFDALARLAEVPVALVRVLLNTTDEASRQAVFALQNELPFLWLALPISAWRAAFGAEWAGLEAAFAHVETAERSNLIMSCLAGKAADLSTLDGSLAAVFARVGFNGPALSTEPSLQDIAQAYVRGQSEGESAETHLMALPDLSGKLAAKGFGLPSDISQLSFKDWGGLLAPAFLALSALEKLPLDTEAKSLVRRVMREDQNAKSPYVSPAFPHFLRFYGA
ncbi:STY4851/ECs_5259 family protein [Asticcacaulis sp. AC402]|uniref:STY4851/ECs_5259 family protein n=1 Tax=Asticcacaulis sp. AC402 TaxID=1282361 RepID=UPI0003C3E61C|nr:STY4851/ECs_5259 family protein [Asticcacaulis sp. AC402]ESQ74518.1 hypothetical protein ABAC402_13600 [Asticcacaulis sp. AC402]